VTKPIADRWAILSARAQHKGLHLANIDGLIAATALEHDLTVVTRNLEDFGEIDLSMINPWKP
jgi:toxin FitB